MASCTAVGARKSVHQGAISSSWSFFFFFFFFVIMCSLFLGTKSLMQR